MCCWQHLSVVALWLPAEECLVSGVNGSVTPGSVVSLVGTLYCISLIRRRTVTIFLLLIFVWLLFEGGIISSENPQTSTTAG